MKCTHLSQPCVSLNNEMNVAFNIKWNKSESYSDATIYSTGKSCCWGYFFSIFFKFCCFLFVDKVYFSMGKRVWMNCGRNSLIKPLHQNEWLGDNGKCDEQKWEKRTQCRFTWRDQPTAKVYLVRYIKQSNGKHWRAIAYNNENERHEWKMSSIWFRCDVKLRKNWINWIEWRSIA